MEKTIQQKLEEALAAYRAAEKDLDDAIENGKRKAVRAAEKALEEAEDNLRAIEDMAEAQEYAAGGEAFPVAEAQAERPAPGTDRQRRLQEALADFYMAEAELDAAIESGKRKKIRAAEKALEEAELALRAVEDEEPEDAEPDHVQLTAAAAAAAAPVWEEQEPAVPAEEIPEPAEAEHIQHSRQELEAALAMFHRAEGALDAAVESGNEKVIDAAEKALEEAEETLHAIEDAVHLEEQADAAGLKEAAEEALDRLEEAEEAAEELAETAEEEGDYAALAAAGQALDAMDAAEDALEAAEDIAEEAAQQDKPKKKKAGLIAGIALGVIALLGGGYYYYANYMQPAAQAPVEEAPPVQVLMPDVVLETADVAEQLLSDMGVEADVLFVSSEKVPAGVVTLQSVSPGQPLPAEAVLYVSMGPAPTPTPDRGPLPTPTPSPTPRPVRTATPIIELPVETPCPTG